MSQEPRTYSLLLFLFLSHGVASHGVPDSRQALLDLIQFQSSHVWTADLSRRVLAYLNSRNVAFTIPSLQVCI
ncbi:hypothetical protein J1605_016402 [Eschrichtius robustus]|uniref:Uncharacterized protein n=1 Tax=Eschrichtius robustus TaxID=9764 RepID=A0AB34I4V2_ESCRO|nr:hypothetical protein J1605_016402 [Eschrichtius robustus]